MSMINSAFMSAEAILYIYISFSEFNFVNRIMNPQVYETLCKIERTDKNTFVNNAE